MDGVSSRDRPGLKLEKPLSRMRESSSDSRPPNAVRDACGVSWYHGTAVGSVAAAGGGNNGGFVSGSGGGGTLRGDAPTAVNGDVTLSLIGGCGDKL